MIEVNNLTKEFGSKLAVDDLSFTVEKGEVLGFLGPNGAGKSTTMRMLTGYIARSGGNVKIGGFDPEAEPLKAKSVMGYLPESAPLYDDMSVRGFLSFMAELRGLSGSAKTRAVDRVIELCFLQSVVKQSIDTLSKGYRHRTCLAQSLLHDPDILIMDEPTDGLDPNQKRQIRDLIRQMGESKAIIFSTHILEEVDAACTRAVIIDQGRMVANGTPEELKRSAKGDPILQVHLSGKIGASIVDSLKGLKGVDKVSKFEAGEDFFVGELVGQKGSDGGKIKTALFKHSLENDYIVEDISSRERSLERLFYSLTHSDAA